jgi:hypothetical protein
MNEVYLNMYRVAVQSGRLPLSFVPEPYRSKLATEMEPEVPAEE